MPLSDELTALKWRIGFQAHEYTDGGVRKIGYGHELRDGEAYPEGITEQQADELLRKDLGLNLV